jgi:hypothetical protein
VGRKRQIATLDPEARVFSSSPREGSAFSWIYNPRPFDQSKELDEVFCVGPREKRASGTFGVAEYVANNSSLRQFVVLTFACPSSYERKSPISKLYGSALLVQPAALEAVQVLVNERWRIAFLTISAFRPSSFAITFSSATPEVVSRS